MNGYPHGPVAYVLKGIKYTFDLVKDEPRF